MTKERSRERSRAPEQKKSVGYTGRAGMERVEAESQRIRDNQNKTYLPYRYRAGWKKGDDFNPVIFLDNSLEDAFFFHEHGVQDARGNFGRDFEVCVKETDNCPMCKLADGGAKNIGRSNYMMLLSVLDLRGYTNKDGEKVPHSRKLFAVKGLQIQDWMKILERAEKKYGTLRGVYVEIGRSGDKEAGTGKPLPLEKDWYGEDAGDVPYSNVEEDDLVAEFGHDAVMSDDGKRVLKEADADITPYKYGELFVYPDVAAMERKYGIKSRNAGSQADIEDGLAEEERPRRGRASRGEEKAEPEDRRSRLTGKRKLAEDAEEETPRTRGRRAAVQDEAVDDEDIPAADNGEEEDTPAPPARTRQREAAKPAAATRSRSRTADVEEEAEEEAPKGRTRSRRDAEPEAPPARERSRSRAAETEDEGEEPEEAAPRSRERVSARSRAAGKPAAAGRGRDKVAAALDDEIPF